MLPVLYRLVQDRHFVCPSWAGSNGRSPGSILLHWESHKTDKWGHKKHSRNSGKMLLFKKENDTPPSAAEKEDDRLSQWIWRFGEFEIYHSLMLHNRRQQYGYPEPVVWKMYAPEPVVQFRKTVTTKGGMIRIRACGNFSVTVVRTGDKGSFGSVKKYGGSSVIELEPGAVEITIRTANTESFPCIYVEGAVESDETWMADDMSQDWSAVGTNAMFTDAGKTPEIFPFSYEKIYYQQREVLEDGVLFDFGRETFAAAEFFGLKDKAVRVQWGESREEALDREWSVIRFDRQPVDGRLSFEPYAFRYIFVSDKNAEAQAEYEYLPLAYRGSFHCSDEVLNRVWDTAAYTFHLNCREFFLDGIKRDRWVWAADAYQCLFVNRYLFWDQDLERRTLTALGGKDPFKVHINNIMDYSFFWIISLYEYYCTYGDRKFMEQIRPQMEHVMAFCRSRTDRDGFMRGRPGDWIFIDWAPMDKTGAVCAEQILYAKAMECFGKILQVLDGEDREYLKLAKEVRDAVFAHFYDQQKGVFTDSYESGENRVTRQTNILAYLFLPCTEEQKRDIYTHVILNEKVPQITTPYFKFYENQVHCMEGNTGILEQSIRTYYGSMLETGATTLYEEYDPNMRGTEHYAMYGNPYEKSLCHAWSTSPVYLLGNYRLGVQNTGIAYDTFAVRPDLGGLASFSGTVPVGKGYVSVSMDSGEVRVTSTVPGGILQVFGREISLEPGKEAIVKKESGKKGRTE